MTIITGLLDQIPDGETVNVTIGLHWTAVVVDVDGQRRCGLASTLFQEGPHGEVDIPGAGRLEKMTPCELAGLARAANLTRRSIGVAAINALLPRLPERYVEINAGDVIASSGAGKTVVLVGHFPFIPELRPRVGRLYVLEQNPGPGEHPAQAADELVPQADVLAITSMTLLNGTLDGLLALRRPESRVLLLGPSTPMHPLLFDYGVEMLLGAIVSDIPPVLRAISQGAVFRQVRKAGVRLVAMT
jgi:uncharacterized protein (DUF4213/DUF364 family)